MRKGIMKGTFDVRVLLDHNYVPSFNKYGGDKNKLVMHIDNAHDSTYEDFLHISVIFPSPSSMLAFGNAMVKYAKKPY